MEPHETEIKVKLRSPEVILERCRLHWGEPIASVQRDEYYDSGNKALRDQDLTLRIRSSNGLTFVALKSPRVFLTETIQTRIELEFEVADVRALRDQLTRQGLSITSVVEKRRLTFGKGLFRVELDRVPFVGFFLEVEAPSVSQIRQVLEELGLAEEDAVRDNYSELIERQLLAMGCELGVPIEGTFAADGSV